MVFVCTQGKIMLKDKQLSYLWGLVLCSGFNKETGGKEGNVSIKCHTWALHTQLPLQKFHYFYFLKYYILNVAFFLKQKLGKSSKSSPRKGQVVSALWLLFRSCVLARATVA